MNINHYLLTGIIVKTVMENAIGDIEKYIYIYIFVQQRTNK